MNSINQYRAILPPDQQLIPAESLIDSRTVRDRLNFLCDFATLINFYDKDNTIKGTWEPFLLKDPVFLLASISKTRLQDHRSQYVNICNKLAHLLEPGTDTKSIVTAFNILFDQFTDVVMKIKRWMYFMLRTDDEYDLKTYVVHQMRTIFRQYFWSVITLRKQLRITNSIPGILPADQSKIFYFDDYEEQLWQENCDKVPYLKILGLNGFAPTEIFNALKNAGDQLLGFFCTTVQRADADFALMSDKKGCYPDTILLRTFVDLLKVHQNQLNGKSKQHLEFYYKNVLKQSQKPAEPDSVYICAELAKPDATFVLPIATQFNAGVDAQNNTVLFSNPEIAELNPASIIGGFTLSSVVTQGSPAVSRLYLRPVSNPGSVQTDKDGKVQSWPTFGGTPGPQALPIKSGFALASPMLLLREGQRQISLQLNFKDQVDTQILAGVAYYLSTQSAWLPVPGNVQPLPAGVTTASQLAVIIELDVSTPPIEAFQTNPDGVQSSWPMLKLEFGSFSSLSMPPVLTSVTVSVAVSGVTTFQLYNDYGALSTKKAYAPFGPLPLLSAEFVIGSSEIFSKPLNSLIIELNWDNLPADFQAYYQQYNNYVNPPPPLSKWAIIRWVKKIFHKSPLPPTEPFNNTCFKVDFGLLENGSWTGLSLTKLALNPDSTSTQKYVTYPIAVADADDNPGTGLFNEINNALANTSAFGYQPGHDAGLPQGSVQLPAGDPGIQQPVLNYTDNTKYGFMRLRLSAPEYGFGSSLYANVVAGITMQNAIKVVNKDDPSTFLPPANPPFAPSLKALTGTYSASVEYRFDIAAGNDTYPIQCFLYTPFKNYAVYDSVQPVPKYGYTINPQPATNAITGIPLWPAFNYKGYLFLELANLLPASSLSLYFELARSYANPYAKAQTDYYYMSDTGWRPLSLLSDNTNNFCGSGIIKVTIPDDVAGGGRAMPGNNYWLCIATKGDTSAFAQTVFLRPNGFAVRRMGNFTTDDTIVPQLAAGMITKTQTAAPQIETIVQPFPSFGGKAAESHTAMTQRVSARLKTKDRAVAPEDYFRLIREEYHDIYYLKPVFDPQSKTTGIYVVKAYDNWTDANAFLPMITECLEEKMSSFLSARASVFSNIRVSNFDFQYVTINATVVVDPAFAGAAIQKTISHALNIFLSPWIKSTQQQVVIDQEITDVQVSNFLRTIEGVLEVNDVTFTTRSAVIQITVTTNKITQGTATSLLVSGMDHLIKWNV